MFSGIMDIVRHPASRRKWLTISRGVFITVALVALYGFGQVTPLGTADDNCRRACGL